WPVRISEIKLEAEQHAKSPDIRILLLVQVSESVDEVHTEEAENILDTISDFNIGYAAGEKADGLPLVRLLGHKRAVHSAHSAENNIGCSDQPPLEFAHQRNAVQQEAFEVVAVVHGRKPVADKLAVVHQIVSDVREER